MTDKLTDTEKKKLADLIAAKTGRVPFKTGMAGVKAATLPFYKNARKVDVKCFTTRPIITKEYVCDGETVFEIDGEEDTLREMNDAFSLTLDADNIAAYLAFYFDAVAAVNDNFARLVSSADDFVTASFDAELAQSLKKLVAPPEIAEQDDGYTAKVFLLCDDVLFYDTLFVARNGGVRLENESVAYDSLPVRRVTLR